MMRIVNQQHIPGTSILISIISSSSVKCVMTSSVLNVGVKQPNVIFTKDKNNLKKQYSFHLDICFINTTFPRYLANNISIDGSIGLLEPFIAFHQ